MRKIFVIHAIICLLMGQYTFGQNTLTKKVAILETVDKENVVPYGVKLMVRSKLGTAVNNTAGYEAYDRVDIASIMNEQEFQRTGFVNASQIKKLGEMTGANFILVADVANIDEKNVVIVAKILDVESAKIDQTANIHSAIDIKELEESCRILAERLLKINFKTGASKGELRIGDNIYFGEYKEDKPHGAGKMVFAKTDYRKSYKGQWVEGLFDGEGTLLYNDGSVYIGNFKDGQKCGIGTYMYADRTSYRGSWEQGAMNGYGQLYDKNGKLMFVGKWENGQQHGEGTAYYSDGEYEEVIYVNGKRNGYATYYFNSGAYEKGSYVAGQKVGKWDCYDAHGNLTATKLYKNGTLIKTKQIKAKKIKSI